MPLSPLEKSASVRAGRGSAFLHIVAASRCAVSFLEPHLMGLRSADIKEMSSLELLCLLP
jgi:hypothetical protein